MLSLKSIYTDLLLEYAANADGIKNAIDTRQLIKIRYQGEGEVAPGLRVIEVHAFGISKGNNEVIRAFQVNGKSNTVGSGWKLFRTDRIDFWEPMTIIDKNTKEQTPIINKLNRPQYNPNGDREMLQIKYLRK